MRIGILIHGHNLGAFQWERVVWGDPRQDALGRVTRALLILLEEEHLSKNEVVSLVIGTGVVWTGGGKRSGRMEAHEMRKTMLERLSTINEFPSIEGRFPAVGSASFIQQLESRINEITCLATTCQNTREEINEARQLFLHAGVDRIILVSSPVHVARCIRDACVAFANDDLRHGVFAAASDTCYQGTTPADVYIREPPHRPDRRMYPIHEFLGRIANVDDDDMEEFLRELNDLLEDYRA